jgi:feruloyl esterase
MKSLILTFALLLASVPTTSHAQPPSCTTLKGVFVEPTFIGLPTRGALVTDAAHMDAQDTNPAHCLISGEIRSMDRTAQNIHFQLALPDTWNGKAAMLGGGGFNGVIPAVTSNPKNMPTDAPTLLARGYAVFASDSGHQAPPNAMPPFDPDSGTFLLNDEQFQNFIGDALKKTRDVSVALIHDATGRAPAKSYFFGSSKGGTEALVLAGRWPKDWDGIVAQYPGRSFTVALVGQLATTQALAAPGAYLTLEKRHALHAAALAACDERDGARDGIISDVAGCRAAFDPATLRCADGADTGDTCLSDAQIAALRKVSEGTHFGFPIAGAEQDFKGFNILTAGLGNADDALGKRVATLTIGTKPAAFPPVEGNSGSAFFSDRFLRTAVARDPNFNQLTFDIMHPDRLGPVLSAMAARDKVEVDLKPFFARKGRLLILHGTDDLLSSPRQIEDYYRQVEHATSTAKVARFVRFYQVPGFGHNSSTIFNAVWDQVSALEGWIEKDIDPTRAYVVTDTASVPGRTRPLCPYPSWAKYKGTGDVNRADAFVCATR